MDYFIKIIFIIFIILISSSCNEKIHYSGKILNTEHFDYEDLNNREEVINKIGQPNYIDSIENKYYYFSERTNEKNFFNKKIKNRTMLVILFNNNDMIELISEYDLNDQQDIKYIKETTPNQIIERGLFEKIFGGVGRGGVPTSN